jgi:hypothetical protein
MGNVNLAAELSVRRNTPLDSDAQIDLTRTGDNDDNPRYAVGNSVHANFSWLAALEPSFIAREADLLGEIAWNRMTSCTKNCVPTPIQKVSTILRERSTSMPTGMQSTSVCSTNLGSVRSGQE